MPERESAGRVLNLVIKFVLGGLLSAGECSTEYGTRRMEYGLGRVEKERETQRDRVAGNKIGYFIGGMLGCKDTGRKAGGAGEQEHRYLPEMSRQGVHQDRKCAAWTVERCSV